MPRSALRASGRALAVSAPVALALAAARIWGSEETAHAAAVAVLVLALPWVIPAFVLLAVASAPAYVALHLLGHPIDLAPWLATVVLLAAVAGWHGNVTLALTCVRGTRPQAPEPGLAEFLRRSGAGAR